MKFLIVDLETCSLKLNEAEIITACAIELDENLNQLSIKDWKIKPRIWRDDYEGATKIHGISKDECLNFGANWNDFSNHLCSFDSDYFVCHANRSTNRTYDYACIKYRMLDEGTIWEFRKAFHERNIISTHSLAKYLEVPGRHGLKDLHSYFNLGEFNHHSVVEDTIACAKLFKIMFPMVNLKEFLLWDNYKNLEIENGNPEPTNKRPNNRGKSSRSNSKSTARSGFTY